ncbi:Nitronate monooxygenase [Balamuthia mandrillaris]
MAFISGAELAVAVSQAGGLGFIAAGYDMLKLEAELRRARSLLSLEEEPSTPLPVGVGLIAWTSARSPSERQQLLSNILSHRPSALWLFAPEESEEEEGGGGGFLSWVNTIHQLSSSSSSPPPAVFAQVGSVKEALEASEAGVDVVVAQGHDAGGHGRKASAGLTALLPEVRDAFSAHHQQKSKEEGAKGRGPLLWAAGGIMDGRGIAAAMALGADGVVLGTRFLVAEEARLPPAHKEAVLKAKDGGRNTTRTRLFDELRSTTGWPAAYDGRALRNEMVRQWEEEGGEPQSNKAERMKEEYRTAVEEGDYERVVVWAGCGVGLAREVKPAAEIVEELVHDYRNVVRELPEKLF